MKKLSPELIRGRWSVQGMDGVSHETIYQWIWQGKAHKSVLLVITDRATLLTRLKKVDTRKQILARIPKSFIKTLTVDNDKGFANHASIAITLDANVYFTRPYTSQDKGTVENRIGEIRSSPQKVPICGM